MGDEPLAPGAVIRRSREARGLSRRQLSQAAGLSTSYVSKVEAGEVDSLSLRSFSKLAVELGLSSREIFVLIKQEAGRD